MLAALTYMVPLGVAAAASVLVGHAIGRGDPEAARREAGAALACGIGFMSVTAVILVSFAPWLARAFTADPGILAVAAVLIPIAGVFQVFDGIQGVSGGILRGAGDTRVPMWSNLAGYALVGLPLGAWLCFESGWGAQGIWWGLVAGLAAVAALLGWRVHVIVGGELKRL
jgi:MATE family multidrug resistance protein